MPFALPTALRGNADALTGSTRPLKALAMGWAFLPSQLKLVACSSSSPGAGIGRAFASLCFV
jgi:hypothetical protein